MDTPPPTPPQLALKQEYYVGNGDSRIGPLPKQAIVDRVQAGDLSPDALIWQSGAADWKPVAEIFPDYLTIASPSVAPKTLPSFPATFKDRFFGHTLDLFILGIPLFVVSMLGGVIMAAIAALVPPLGALGMVFLMIALPAVLIGYPTLSLLSPHAATPGMQIMRIKAVNDEGGKITLGSSLIRALVGGIISPLFGIGFIWPLFDSRGRALHDVAAGTLIVKA